MVNDDTGGGNRDDYGGGCMITMSIFIFTERSGITLQKDKTAHS